MSGEMIQRAFALHQGGRLAEAEQLYRQALAPNGVFRGGGDGMAHFMFALALHQQQKNADALAAVDAALQRAPALIDGLMLRGALLQGMGRPAAALADFAAVTSRAAIASPPIPPQALQQAWFNQGVVLGELGRHAEAIAAADRALAIQPSAQAWNNRGAALRALGRHAEALESFDKALAVTPSFTMAAINRALAFNDLGRSSDALAETDRLLAASPRTASLLVNRGVALHALRRFEEAATTYEHLLALDTRHASAWSNRGDALAQLKRPTDAVVSYDQALAIAPERAETWRRRGDAFLALKQFDEAVESYDQALTRAPGVLDVQIGRAEALAAARRFDEALAAYDLVLAAAPETVIAWRGRCAALHAIQRFDEALAAVDRALALEPDDADALQARGKVLCEMGRVEEGMAVFARRTARLYARQAPDPVAAEPKLRHDAEQRAWLAEQGITVLGHHIEGGERVASGAVNATNRDKVAADWAASDPKIVVIDNLLTPEALEALRRFCRGSTVWRRPYRQGYLGAFDTTGFAAPLIAQIAEELRAVFPTVVEDHGLVTAWGFKYDSRLGGIRIHADQAAVNVNFWITPDEANLNPEGGGMVIWDKAAPLDWEITKYNGDDDAVRAFLAESHAKAITVPYRANRAVIFDSDLFHETDKIEFAEGYENRRVNVTMLYGRRSFLNI